MTDKKKMSNFYWDDERNYWKKIRCLVHEFFKAHDESFAEEDALSLCTHFNLGPGSSGRATEQDVKEEYVKWVSGLLNKTLTPAAVIMFGLKQIMVEGKVTLWWNDGIWRQPLDWGKPKVVVPFKAKKEYKLRIWPRVTTENGHKFPIIMWPNHPSRPPFGGFDEWKRSVASFLSEVYQIKH